MNPVYIDADDFLSIVTTLTHRTITENKLKHVEDIEAHLALVAQIAAQVLDGLRNQGYELSKDWKSKV